MAYYENDYSLNSIASSRRSVSQGAIQKAARGKIKKKRFFFIFSRAVFCTAPRLTERLEEAMNSTTRGQLLINRIYNKFWFWEVLLSEKIRSAFQLLKTVRNIAKNAIKAGVISISKFKLDTCNWTPTRWRADYVTNRRAENQSRSRISL